MKSEAPNPHPRTTNPVELRHKLLSAKAGLAARARPGKPPAYYTPSAV